MALTIWQLDPAQMTIYYNVSLCDALAKAGSQVRYVTTQFLYDPEAPISTSFTTDYHYFRGLNHAWLLEYTRLRRLLRALSYPLDHWRLLRKLRQNPPDIVHIQWSRVPIIDQWLISRIQALGIPIVHTVHDVMPLFAGRRKDTALEHIYESVDGVVVHTKANRQSLLKTYPHIRPERIHIIPVLEAITSALDIEDDQAAARRRLGLPEDVPIVLFFGSIRQYKGLDTLVKAFPLAAAERSDFWLVVAGRPETSEEADLLKQLEDQPRTHVRGAFIPHDEVEAYHVAADVLVFPYHHIYQSGALITAMGFGRAVIVTEVGGMPETIDGNGWIVPPDDPPALAEVILEAVSDRERLRQMGERSRQIIDENHTGAVVARQTIAMYEQILQGR